MAQTVEEQLKIIGKGADTIVNHNELREKIKCSMDTSTPMTIKLGLDPSAPDIHLGHAVVLRKIRQMQDMGHKAFIVIGDFTGRIGDPSGKSKTRKPLTKEQVLENAQTYQNQIFKILDKDKTQVHFNSEWLSKLNFEQVLSLASATTVARILERDDFKARYQNNAPIGLHEFFYPLMQAYDSVAIKADIELGGTDQTFNILMGRTLQKAYGMEPQAAVFMPLLEGLDGIEKMSKSLGNYIGIYEEAPIMFKKVMEIPDFLILKYYELATDVHPDEIALIRQELDNGKNPRDVKLSLAHTITSLYHSSEETKKAEDYYRDAFSKKSIPADIPELTIPLNQDTLADIIPILVKAGMVQSSSEFRRLLGQGGVQLNQEKISDLNQVIYCNDVLKIGKKTFLRFIK